MGYHILLHCRARMTPEFLHWMTPAFFTEEWEDTVIDESGNECPAHPAPQNVCDLHHRWHRFDICEGFQEFSIQGDRLAFRLSNKWNRHHGNLQRDYLQAMKTVIAPMSHIIEYCEIEHDDYGDARYQYTDEEIREG